MPKKILVVDDDEHVVGFLNVGLSQAGYNVITAKDGEEGLASARQNRPDLILLDLAMPRMNGYQVCQAVRSDKDLSGTKIVVTSGKNYPVDIKAAKQVGADHYLVKPFVLPELLKILEKLLGASTSSTP